MAVIRCKLAKDGKLIPSIVEFEPGDAIQFKSDKPVHVAGENPERMEVLNPFALNAIAIHLKEGVVEIDQPKIKGEPWRNMDLHNPPPPPPTTVVVILQESIPAAAG